MKNNSNEHRASNYLIKEMIWARTLHFPPHKGLLYYPVNPPNIPGPSRIISRFPKLIPGAITCSGLSISTFRHGYMKREHKNNIFNMFIKFIVSFCFRFVLTFLNAKALYKVTVYLTHSLTLSLTNSLTHQRVMLHRCRRDPIVFHRITYKVYRNHVKQSKFALACRNVFQEIEFAYS